MCCQKKYTKLRKKIKNVNIFIISIYIHYFNVLFLLSDDDR